MTCGRFWHRFAHLKNNEFKFYFEVMKIVSNIIKLNKTSKNKETVRDIYSEL